MGCNLSIKHKDFNDILAMSFLCSATQLLVSNFFDFYRRVSKRRVTGRQKQTNRESDKQRETETDRELTQSREFILFIVHQ